MTASIRALALLSLLGISGLAAQQPAAPPAPAPAQTGRVAGRVLDRETGRPLQAARISLVGVPGVVETDLDGRYRTPAVPVGAYTVRAAMIGYSPQRRDSVRVAANATVTVDFALEVQAVELAELAAEAEIPQAPKTDAGLLAAQQAAPSVSDGISAEAISRNPDSDGGDVIRRVTGITVFDRKFVIVRGLNERYSTTQLNGADLPSPEPLKKVAPLDIFPANLLESIVTTKSATPDKPGDFTGGAVEIRTKEFPEQFTMQFGITQGFNSQTTFQPMRIGPRSSGDLFAFGDARRRPSREALSGNPALGERAEESFRDVWTGRRQEAAPNLGLSFNVGGQFGETSPVGYVLAFTYSNRRQYNPDRLVAFRPLIEVDDGNGRLLDESVSEVEWGAIANLSWRLGGGHKFGLKNLYTRGAEETFVQGPGYNTENESTNYSYGVQYVERELFQSQLSGEHLLGFLFGSRLEWKGTLARARRLEPESRRATYTPAGANARLTQFTPFQVRDLTDNIRTAQVDLSIPLSLRRTADASLKFGGLLRDKPRDFTSGYIQAEILDGSDPSLALGPNQTFAPENVGSALGFFRFDAIGRDYHSQDDLTAFYGMADVPLLPRVRLVGGLRVEHWRLTIESGAESPGTGFELEDVLWRRPWDYLWSANLTVALTDAMNLRLAAFRSLNRPDPRELVADVYTPVAQECGIVGDTSVTDSRIVNADVRWEYYPRPGELLAVSGFYKKFDDPLVEVIGSGASACTQFIDNGTVAKNYGVELEARRALDFLPGFLGYLSIGANATILQSTVDLDTLRFGNARDLPLQGQSPLVINANVGYTIPGWETNLTLLVNFVDDRIARYGSGNPADPASPRPVNVIEESRTTVDIKAQQVFGRMKVSLSGTNLTNAPVRWSLDGSDGKAVTRFHRTGTNWSLGVSYDIF